MLELNRTYTVRLSSIFLGNIKVLDIYTSTQTKSICFLHRNIWFQNQNYLIRKLLHLNRKTFIL